MATGDRVRWALALAILLVAVPSGGFHPNSTASPLTTTVAPASAGAGCLAPLPWGNMTGALAIDGGPLTPSSDAGVAFRLNYSVEWVEYQEPAHLRITDGCANGTMVVTTNGAGTFSDAIATPANSCVTDAGGFLCVEYGRAEDPVTVSPVAAPPAGYALSVAYPLQSLAMSLAFVWQLATVSLDPSGPSVSVAPGSSVALQATGEAANGSASPLSVLYNWTVSGTGWTLFAGPGGSAEITGVAGASVGTVTVRASATTGTVVLRPPPVSRYVLVVPTAIDGATISPTAVDEGTEVNVTVYGTGPPGYPYSVEVTAGLGAAALDAPCTTSASAGGTASIFCAATVAYTNAGTAQPSATLTNGYGVADWTFPSVTVVPAPIVRATPTAVIGYAGTPVPIVVSVENGTGVPPYSVACLDPGNGTNTCVAGSGPTWSFAPVYATAGVYEARATVSDGLGTSGSVGVPVSVVGPLSVAPLRLDSANLTAGAATTIFANLSGGALPVHLWWNASFDAGGPVATATVASDGTVSAVVLPTDPGVASVTLTVVDALGSVVRVVAPYAVLPAPAVRVTATERPSAPVVAGIGAPIVFSALDPSGAPTPGFDAPTLLLVHGGAAVARVTVNVSGVGPLTGVGNGSFDVPGSAWLGGSLNVSVVPDGAGALTVWLTGAALPNAVAPVTLSVAPNDRNVLLYDPAVVTAGARTNATLWHVEDDFGDAVPGAVLHVVATFGPSVTSSAVRAIELPGGASGVWVNFSAPVPSSGAIAVTDAAGLTVLGPIAVPAQPGASGPSPLVLAAVAGPSAAAALGIVVVVRRRRGGSTSDGEAELRALAEGRAAVVELLRHIGPADLDGVERAWPSRPVPSALADWLTSLVADGTVGAVVGPDRIARFCLRDGPRRPRVEIDPEALESALRRRDEDERAAA